MRGPRTWSTGGRGSGYGDMLFAARLGGSSLSRWLGLGGCFPRASCEAANKCMRWILPTGSRFRQGLSSPVNISRGKRRVKAECDSKNTYP